MPTTKHNGTVLRASVTSEAGGVNYCPNPGPLQDVTLWAVNGGGGANIPTLEWTTLQPDANPIGASGCGHVVWAALDPAATLPQALVIPDNGGLLAGTEYTVSLWVYVPSGSNGVTLVCDSHFGTDSGALKDQWVRLSVTFVASSTTPAMALWIDSVDTQAAGMEVFFAGGLIQPGSTVGVYTNGGGQDGDPVQVLIDGSDTPVTANGLTGYIPTPGDRLLVQRVGGQMEVVQWLSRGTVPYVQGSDLSDLQAQVSSNTDDIASTSSYASATNTDLQNYKSTTDTTLTGLQGAYDVLSGIGAAGVTEDYIWVGDDPALSTVKSVQISTFVQGGLYAGDAGTFSTYFGLWDQTDIGDITFSGTASPPMTTFYEVFTGVGLSIVTGKDYGA